MVINAGVIYLSDNVVVVTVIVIVSGYRFCGRDHGVMRSVIVVIVFVVVVIISNFMHLC